MNRMADTVIKEMDNKAHEEEMKIRKWEMQREMAERKKEEERLKRIKNGNEACKKNLFRQI
jgi:nucleosome binding factor SPN SPT16 subunit